MRWAGDWKYQGDTGWVKHGHHNSDCQEGITGGLRISRNKNQEEEIKEHKGLLRQCDFDYYMLEEWSD